MVEIKESFDFIIVGAGSAVSFRFDTGYCHLFDAENGARLH